jgi:DNA-binding response OmpR family regulator
MTQKKVIVTDNNFELLNLLKRQLQESMSPEYLVATEKWGSKVLFQLRQHPEVELLVIGDVLPDMSGFELAQEARYISPDTQIFLMSSQAMPDFEEKVEQLHLKLDGYLNKTALYLELLELEGRVGDENNRWSIFES